MVSEVRGAKITSFYWYTMGVITIFFRMPALVRKSGV